MKCNIIATVTSRNKNFIAYIFADYQAQNIIPSSRNHITHADIALIILTSHFIEGRERIFRVQFPKLGKTL